MGCTLSDTPFPDKKAPATRARACYYFFPNNRCQKFRFGSSAAASSECSPELPERSVSCCWIVPACNACAAVKAAVVDCRASCAAVRAAVVSCKDLPSVAIWASFAESCSCSIVICDSSNDISDFSISLCGFCGSLSASSCGFGGVSVSPLCSICDFTAAACDSSSIKRLLTLRSSPCIPSASIALLTVGFDTPSSSASSLMVISIPFSVPQHRRCHP